MFDELHHKISKDTIVLEKTDSLEGGRNTLKDNFPQHQGCICKYRRIFQHKEAVRLSLKSEISHLVTDYSFRHSTSKK